MHPTPDKHGMGLTGLDYRVAAVDGTFQARAERQRWVVQARLPRCLTEATA